MPVYRTTLLNPRSDQELQFFKDALITVEQGKIFDCADLSTEPGLCDSQPGYLDYGNKLVLPCFTDLHFHWVQEDVCHMPKTKLMSWLSAYTWPTEAKFESRVFSKIKAEAFFEDLFNQGTTIGAIYSSIHEHTIDDVFKYARGSFIAGAVTMTKGEPDYLVEAEQEAIEKNRRLSKKYAESYVLSPRFIPSCTELTLTELAKIAKEYGSWLQTHLAETKNPEESDWKLLRETGILGPKTILGHCIHLEDAAFAALAASGSKIAHCPSSNAPVKDLGLGSGLFDFRRAEAHGCDWALASDIGAGPYLSMLDVMSSFCLQNQKAGIEEATAIKALYRATLKGAEILGLSKTKGNLDIGKDADFVIIDKKAAGLDDAFMASLPQKAAAEKILTQIFKLDRKVLAGLVEEVYLC